jgi:peptide/nickel transport system substrate-binding protein
MRKHLLLFTLTVLLFSCGGKKQRSLQVFRYNQVSGIETLDPAFARNLAIMWGVNQVYNSLVEVDDSLHVRPSLAQSWDISADRLTYTFHLRPNVRFHDHAVFPEGKGRLMTAQDVVYSFARIIDPATASSGAWIFNGRVDSLHAFTALNDSTFQLRLQEPFNPILELLSMKYCSVVPREVVEKYGKDFRNHPCGTGPFQLKQWEEGQALILARNPHYWERDEQGKPLPYLDALKITFIDSRVTEFLMFRKGELDFMNSLDVNFKDQVLTKKGELKPAFASQFQLHKIPYLNTEYLGFLTDTANPLLHNSPLRNVKVRQAFNYGIDRKKMMLYLRNSVGTPANAGFIPQGLPGFDSTIVKGYHYDPAKALQLLAEAGYPEGRGLPEIPLLTQDNYSDLCNYVASQLGELGVRIRVEVVQPSLLREQMSKSQALFFRGSWIADYPDAETYLTFFYGQNPAPPNYTRFNDAQYDAWYRKSLSTPDSAERIHLYQQMDQRLVAQAPVIPMFYDQVLHFLQKDVQGFKSNPLNMLDLRRVKFDR